MSDEDKSFSTKVSFNDEKQIEESALKRDDSTLQASELPRNTMSNERELPQPKIETKDNSLEDGLALQDEAMPESETLDVAMNANKDALETNSYKRKGLVWTKRKLLQNRQNLNLDLAVFKKMHAWIGSELKIKDERQSGKVRFSASSLIFVLTVSFLCGKTSACAIANFWHSHLELLGKIDPDLANNKVSHDTIKRALENISFPLFQDYLNRFALMAVIECTDNMLMQQNSEKIAALNTQASNELNTILLAKDRAAPYEVVVRGSSHSDKSKPLSERAKLLRKQDTILTRMRKYHFNGVIRKVNLIIVEDQAAAYTLENAAPKQESSSNQEVL